MSFPSKRYKCKGPSLSLFHTSNKTFNPHQTHTNAKIHMQIASSVSYSNLQALQQLASELYTEGNTSNFLLEQVTTESSLTTEFPTNHWRCWHSYGLPSYVIIELLNFSTGNPALFITFFQNLLPYAFLELQTFSFCARTTDDGPYIRSSYFVFKHKHSILQYNCVILQINTIVRSACFLFMDLKSIFPLSVFVFTHGVYWTNNELSMYVSNVCKILTQTLDERHSLNVM